MSDKPTDNSHTVDQVRAVKTAAKGAFERLAEVAGVGVTRIGKGYGLKVNLRSHPKAKTVLPTEIRGVPVRVEVVGAIKKRAA
jgi:hypothetical protein